MSKVYAKAAAAHRIATNLVIMLATAALDIAAFVGLATFFTWLLGA